MNDRKTAGRVKSDGEAQRVNAASRSINHASVDAQLLPGFERRLVEIDGHPVLTLTAGSGPPVLLLHGDPQTHLCWHEIASRLAERHTVVLTDLRGRGESHKPAPASDPASNPYAKRLMAAEQVAVMRALGHERFALVGHDRGARVARRMALDHPDAIERLCVMDFVPALDLYERTTAEIAQDFFFFLTQPRPQPERLIAGDPEGFMRQILFGLGDRPVPYDTHALAVYLQSASDPAAVAAMCECFRAGFTIDREHDRADRAAGRRIACPTLVLWGERGVVGRHFDMRSIWNAWCADARFAPMPSGHFIPEEAPSEAYAELAVFLQ